MISSLWARRTTGRRRALRTIAATTAVALLLPAALISVATAPNASAAAAVIEAIRTGGTVIGDQCRDGRVVGPEHITDLGPETTLYVKDVGSTFLVKTVGTDWKNGSNDPKVVFKNSAENELAIHVPAPGMDASNAMWQFGASDGSAGSVPRSPTKGGFVTMVFDDGFRDKTILGTLVTADYVYNGGDDFWACTSGDSPPKQPTILNATVGKHQGTVTLDPDDGQGIYSYKLRFQKDNTNINFDVPDATNESSTISFIQSNDKTVVSFKDDRLPNQKQDETGVTDDFEGTWKVYVTAISGAGDSDQSEPKTFEFDAAIEEPSRKISHVVDVVHYKETEGKVASKINIQGGGNEAGGVCKDGSMASDGYWCVVGAGYDPDGAKSWNNTFRVKLDGTAPDDASVWIGIDEADAVPVGDSNKDCPSGNGNLRASDRTLCLALDKRFEETQGEQYLYLKDGSTDEFLPFAVWDFGGDPDEDEIWGQKPKEGYTWADYHILIVEEGVSSGTFDEDSTDFTDFCDGSSWENLPTRSKPIDCQQHGIELRAIFDWDNSQVLGSLGWLDKVQQLGSRSADNKPEDFVNPTSLGSGRIPNQIADGDMAFFQMGGLGGKAISNLDTSNLTDMHRMFLQAENFNGDLNSWDTSNVTDMSRMFEDAKNFNGGLSSWVTSNVTDMSRMFSGARKFNQNLSSWDTSNVEDMSYMFRQASVFSGDLSSWVTSKVEDMSYMFDRAYMFRTGTSGWNTSNVEDMSYMFKEAYDDQKSGFNEDISRWNTSKVKSTRGMFVDAIHFNQDISGWDTSEVTDMSYMFRLNPLDDGSGVPFIRQFNQDLSGWNVLKVSSYDYFDDVPDIDRDLWTGDFCNSGRPIWGTRGGCLDLSTVPNQPVRAEESDIDKENFDVRNVFSLAVEPPRSESDARALESYPLFYSIRNEGNLDVTTAPNSEEQLKLERDAQGTGFMKVPVSEMFNPSLNIEVTAESSVEGEDLSTSFDVFAPCKADDDVVVSVEQVGAVRVDSVEVKVTLEAKFGVVPPGTVTLVGSGGFESTPIKVSGGESTWTSDSEKVEIKLPGTAATMTSAELVERVVGTMQGTFTWGALQGDEDDGGPEDCEEGGTSTSAWVPFQLDVSKDLICSVYPAFTELQQELATPGTADVTVSARSGGMQVRAGDVDGDGVANEDDPDVDGDGTPNESDSDIDGDGSPNVTDPDMDGDGIANAGDDFPKGPPPVARPMPIGLTEAEREALLEQLYGEQVPVTYPVPGSDFEDGGDYAEGAGQIVVGPDPEIVVDLAVDRVRKAGQGLDCDGFDIELPEFGWPVIPDGETGSGSDSGTGGDSGGGPGTGGSTGDSGSGAAGGLRVALAAPAEAFKGVPAELEATVTPSTTDGVVEFAVREIDLNGEETVRLLGSAPVEDGKATIKLVPEDYGDAIVYARVTEEGSGAQDVAARAAVVNPAPFADNFSLTVGGDAWLPVETGNVLGYGYSPVEFTTMTGEAPRITTPVDGPCQVLSTRSIPPQIRMLGTAIAPKRCSFTVTTPGGGAYAPVSYTYDVALSMGTQTATLAADRAKKTIKKGSMVTLAKKTQTKTDENYKLKGKKINWSVTSGKDVCSVKTSSSGKVSVKGKKTGTCTVKAKAGKVKGKYKSFTEFYSFRVQ